MSLVGTIIIGVLFIGAMVGFTRMDTAGHESDPGDSTLNDTLGSIDSVLTTEKVPQALAGLGTLLTVVGIVLVLNELFFELGALLGVVEGTAMLALFVVAGLGVFLGSYGLSKQHGLGTAHGLAAGVFVAGVVFVFLIAADLTVGVIR